MNYTQNKSSCEVNSSLIIDNHTNLSNISKKSSKQKQERMSHSFDSASALLGNREIGKRSEKISKYYKKYLSKHISQYSHTVGNITDNEKEKRRLKNKLPKPEFELKLKNDAILKKINQSLCSCGRDVHYMNDKKIVDFKENGKTRRITGLKSCGNNSACPVCAAKLSAIRGNQLKELMTVGRDNGRSYSLVVVTIPHQPKEPLEVTLNQVIDMSRYIFNSREYKEFKKLSSCRFVDGGLENMVSFKNGLVDWHPHKNYLLDFDNSISSVIKKLGLKNELEFRMYISRMMTSLGQRFLDKKGIQKTLLVPRMQENKNTKKIDIKSGVSAALEFDDEYISKWGLDAEMTAGIYKNGRFDGSTDDYGNLKTSFHPFVLLDFIDINNEETSEDFKYQCIKAFQEFVLASRGKWWFYFGKGQVDYYNKNYDSKIKVKKDELELITLEDNGNIFYSLTHEEWLDFEPNSQKIGFALSLPTTNDVIEFVFEEIEFNRIQNLEKGG